MRRILYILGFLLIMLIGITPYIHGLLFEQKFLHTLETINEDERLKVNVLTYHGGWFSSHAKIQVTVINEDLKQLPALSLPTTFIIEQYIQHGPVIFDKKKRIFTFGYALVQSNVFSEHGKTPVVQVDMLSNFKNHWIGNFHVVPFALSLPSIGKIRIGESNGDFNIQFGKTRIKQITVTSEMGTLLFNGDAQNTPIKELNIQSIKSSYTILRTNNIWSGNSSLYTPEMALERTDGATFISKKINVNNTFSFDKNRLYNSNIGISVRSVISPSRTLPAFSKLDMTFSFNDFNTKELNDYIDFLQNQTGEEIKKIDLRKIENLLAHTITQTSIVRGSISADTSLGAFTCRTKTLWPEEAPLPDTINDVVTKSYTKIKLTFSDTLLLKLLTIYGDQITAATHAEAQKLKPETTLLEQVYFQKQSTQTDNEFRQTVEDLRKAGKISVPVAMQIFDLQKQKQSLEAFSANIDQLTLSTNIKNQLKSTYQLQIEDIQPVVPTDKLKELLGNLISVGYLSLDKETGEYISRIVIEEGKLQIYGSPVISETSEEEKEEVE
jgi:hypothetical protein